MCLPGELISGCDPLGRCQPFQDPRKMWLAAGSLFTVWWRMPVSGAEIAAAPFLPALAVTHLPLCLWGGRALYGNWLALFCYSLYPLFCDCARDRCASLEPFMGKVFYYYFVMSLMIPWFGLLCHISSLIVLRAFRPSPYPKGQ